MTSAPTESTNHANDASHASDLAGAVVGTRVDFAFGAPHRIRTACQTAYKHYLAGRRLLVYSTDASVLQTFDKLLWSFEPTAFIPHVYADHAEAATTPVVLCHTSPLDEALRLFEDIPWLINLDLACPPQFVQFARILEIVSAQPEDRDAARTRWKAYQAAGIKPNAYDISAVR